MGLVGLWTGLVAGDVPQDFSGPQRHGAVLAGGGRRLGQRLLRQHAQDLECGHGPVHQHAAGPHRLGALLAVRRAQDCVRLGGQDNQSELADFVLGDFWVRFRKIGLS